MAERSPCCKPLAASELTACPVYKTLVILSIGEVVLNWEVFTRLSPPEIQIHWATAAVAFALGLIIFLRPKGTLPHKTLGVFYASLMTVTSASAFFIRSGDVSGWAYL
ncbi:MAG: hypothetical protein AAGK23_13465, partial [Pseudomonadota bacterium]